MVKIIRFTGVIEDIGEVVFKGTSAQNQSLIALKIKPQQILNQLNPGEDIAVNGVCLTIKEINGSSFTVQLWPVTQQKTTLMNLDCGDWVNLERRANREEIGNEPVC